MVRSLPPSIRHHHVLRHALPERQAVVQLARWIDSTILDALYGWGFGADRPHTNFDPLIGLNNAFGDMLLNFVMAMMFIVLPTFWVMALAWAGVRTGNIVQGLSTSTSDAKGAGGRGAGMAMSAVSKK